MFYVYALQSLADDTIYIGKTNDLRRRLSEHKEGKSKWAKEKQSFRLIYYESYLSPDDASRREHNLKRHSGALTHLRKRLSESLKTDSM